MNRALLKATTTVTGIRGTPDHIYSWLDRCFHFTIDLASLAHNAKHPRFYSPKENSLAQSWEGETGFLNPPYGRAIGQWIEKSRESAMYERAVTVKLLPARTGSDWWQTFVKSRDGAAGRLLRTVFVPETGMLWLRWEGLITGIYEHSERIIFDGMEDGAPFDSAVVIHASPSRRLPPPTLEPEDLDLTLGWPR